MTDESFAKLLELAPDAMIVMVNGQTESMFGYDRAELIGKTVETLIPKAARKRHRKYIADYFGRVRVRPGGQNMSLSALRRALGDETSRGET